MSQAEDTDDFPAISVATLLPFWGSQLIFAILAIVCSPVLHLDILEKMTVPTSEESIRLIICCTVSLLALNTVLERVAPESWKSEKFVNSFILQTFGATRNFPAVFAAVLITGLNAGIGEELFFRGVIQEGISHTDFGVTGGLIIASLIFGAGHAQTNWYAAVATLSGIIFGTLYNATSDLSVPITVHALYDIIVVLLVHFKVTGLTTLEKRELLDAYEF